MSAAASVPVMVRLPAWRARFALAALLAAFLVLAGRSVYLQSMRTGFLQEKGEARYARVLEIPATRGRIVDRNGEALAISTPVKSIWAIPEDVKATRDLMEMQAGTMGVAVGGELREEKFDYNPSQAFQIGDVAGFGGNVFGVGVRGARGADLQVAGARRGRALRQLPGRRQHHQPEDLLPLHARSGGPGSRLLRLGIPRAVAYRPLHAATVERHGERLA